MMDFFRSFYNEIGIYIEFLFFMIVNFSKSAVHFFGMGLELTFFYLIPAYLIFSLGVWGVWFFLVKKEQQISLKKFIKTNKWLKYSFFFLTALLIIFASWNENYHISLYYYIRSIF